MVILLGWLWMQAQVVFSKKIGFVWLTICFLSYILRQVIGFQHVVCLILRVVGVANIKGSMPGGYLSSTPMPVVDRAFQKDSRAFVQFCYRNQSLSFSSLWESFKAKQGAVHKVTAMTKVTWPSSKFQMSSGSGPALWKREHEKDTRHTHTYLLHISHCVVQGGSLN